MPPGRDAPLTGKMTDRIVMLGRLFYAVGMAAIGVQHFVNGDFVAVILPSYPEGIPGHAFWTYAFGAGLVVSGAAMALGGKARPAAILLGTALLAAILFRDIPVQLAGNFRYLGAWTNVFKALTLSGGAFVVAATAHRENEPSLDRFFVGFGCFGLAVTVAVFGIDHFIYTEFVASLVPSWIPGHVFWTYFCGAALIAAGAGMLLGIKARLAAGLLGSIIFVWLLVLHIPRAIADPTGANGDEWTSVFEALAFSGIAFILARKLPKKKG